ncbi:hypothetical protein L484_007249 [Morus notabilis]|uniref:Uncharacterized protein n=1 Tax=Morus notabilis TaxID=981085 RepID=W9RMN9_9ROSA|nr:hypothetical protein L484_007249 [Morus notabilis]
MASNLELFLLAFLHGSFIATLLLLAVSLASIGLLLSFFIGLFSVVAIDLLNVYPIISWYFEEAKMNLKLGLVLGIALGMKLLFGGAVFKFKGRLRDHIDALKLA